MNERSKLILVLSTIGSMICLNVLAIQNFMRVDFTTTGIYTLSDMSKKTMHDLEDVVTITAYFTSDLPPPYSSNARYTRDLLEEYRSESNGMFSFQFLDPQVGETEKDRRIKKDVKQNWLGQRVREKTSVETELEALGIQAVEVRVLEDDDEQTKRGWMGIRINYQDESKVIPVVQQTNDLEYRLTTIIRNMTRSRVPVLGVAQGHGEPNIDEELKGLKEHFKDSYEIKGIDLKTGLTEDGQIPEDFDALLVASPKETFGEKELKALDAFMMKGKSAAFFVGLLDMDLSTFQGTPLDHGLSGHLASYGIEMGNQLVGDASATQLPMRRQGIPIPMMVPYPFIPKVINLNQDSPVTRGLTEVLTPFPVSLYLSDEAKKGGELRGAVLATSSENSWMEDATPESINPQRWVQDPAVPSFTGPYNLIASVDGKLKSHYSDARSEKDGRVLVIGSGQLMHEAFLRQQPNARLLLNIIDWLLQEEGLLNMRKLDFVSAPLDPDLSDNTRNIVKYGNVVGLPLSLSLLGGVLWTRRSARRRKLEQTAEKQG